MRNVSLTLDVYTLIVTWILFVVCTLEKKQNKQINTYYLWWISMQMMTLLCDCARWIMRGKIEFLVPFTICYHLEFILCYGCLICFHLYIIETLNEQAGINRKWEIIVWPVAALTCMIWGLSYSSRAFYIITYNAVNVHGDYFWIVHIPALLVILLDFGLCLSSQKTLGKRHLLSLLLFIGFAILSFPLQLVWNTGVLFLGMTISILSRYMTINSEQNRLLAESRARLAESKVAITMSQIQPHFLYNALGSISVLCDIDPEKARNATDHFAEYLRMNLDSMKLTNPIPFRKELDHIKTYLWLEQMRFGEKLQVEIDVQIMEFLVPALSVQPLVENAVKHGVCKKADGGHVSISTREEKDRILITVCDDGVGFDPNQTERIEEDGDRQHIGIGNVKYRLEYMVGGELEIDSTPGEGTKAVISIPKKEDSYL